MASGVVEIAPIWGALGEEKALHVFHAFTGADTVGRFFELGKTKWSQQYMKAYHGYHRDNHGDILTTTTYIPPAPHAILELIRCQRTA